MWDRPARGPPRLFYLVDADLVGHGAGPRVPALASPITHRRFTIGVDEHGAMKSPTTPLAFLRSYSDKRGRNAKLSETSVTDSLAFTEQVARWQA